MTRSTLWALALLLLAPAASAQDFGSFQPVLDAVEQALGKTGKLAIIRPEATGTTQDLSGLEELLVERLSRRENLVVVPPQEVFERVGPEFPVSPEGISSVAKKFEAGAALFARVFMSPEKTELHVLLVSAEAQVLVDQSFPIEALPAPKEPPAQPPEESAAAPPEPEPPAEAPQPPEPTRPDAAGPIEPEQPPPDDPYTRRRLALAPRDRLVGGSSVGVAGRHVALGFHTPVMIKSDWMILEGDRPISELQLAKLTGFGDIAKRIQSDISSMKTIRNVGVGMTLGGFVTAGIAFPFVKADGSDKVTTAGVLVGTGLAAGVAGLVLWLLYGPDAGLAETPYPVHHLITREEAVKMIRSYNQNLRKQLTPPRPPVVPGKARIITMRLITYPTRGGGGAALQFRF